MSSVIRGKVPLIAELMILAVWAVWVGRAYLNLDPGMVPTGREYSSAIQTHHLWTQFQRCGWCAVWSGFERGGNPAFVDPHGSMLHPVVIVTTLLWGVVNGSKIALVASLWFAGIAQWWLARALRLGTVARLWSAMMAVAGGHLAARMELGAFGVVLSTAMCSLVFAPMIELSQRGNRRSAVLLAVTLALALLAGQGYMQFGLLGLGLSALFLFFEPNLRLRPAWRWLFLAGILTLFLSAPFLVPLAHFGPNFGKDADLAFKAAQPLEYFPLNLVIRDLKFLNSDSLSKFPYPHLYGMYIGWVPVLLAVLCLRFERREDRRALLFLAATVLVEFLIGSAVLMRWMARVWPSVAVVRHTPQIAGLAVPPILALAAYGLDKLLALDWPRVELGLIYGQHRSSRRGLNLSLLLLIPLVVGLRDCYRFTQTWYQVAPVGKGVYAVLDALRTPTLQWVEPPFGEHFFIEPAIDAGLKLSPGIQTWFWKERPFPQPYLEANRKGPPPDTKMVDTADGIPIYFGEGREYAFVQTKEGTIPCQARGNGGTLSVECSTDAPGILTVRENSWSGWYAWRDGNEVPLRYNRWLSVEAPPGEHRYHFRYLPWDVPLGLALCVIGIAVGVWLYFSERGEEQP